MSSSGQGPTIGGPQGPSLGGEDQNEDAEEIKDQLDKIDEKLDTAEIDRQKKHDQIFALSIRTLEDVYYAVVLTFGVVGILGTIGTLTIGAYPFTVIFAVGSAFLIYAHYHGFPHTI